MPVIDMNQKNELRMVAGIVQQTPVNTCSSALSILGNSKYQ